jgi:hypothetical protein
MEYGTKKIAARNVGSISLSALKRLVPEAFNTIKLNDWKNTTAHVRKIPDN